MAVPEAEERINLSQVCGNNLSLVHKGVRNGSGGSSQLQYLIAEQGSAFLLLSTGVSLVARGVPDNESN